MADQHCLEIDNDDVAPYVLLPGDPGRVEVVARLWDSYKVVAAHREFVTATGLYRGVPLTCTSTGIGAPSAAIAMEELASAGAHTFLRIGTCGTFQDHVAPGDLAIFDSAMRLDGTSFQYAPPEFPAVADVDVVRAAREAAKALEMRAHVGTTRTADVLYGGHPRPGASFGSYWRAEWKEQYEDFRRMNVLAAEMEASVILVLARLWRLRAGGIALVLNNELEASSDYDPENEYLSDPAAIERMARVGCETLRLVAAEDRTRQ